MSFTSRRGRPKQDASEKDYGTPELIKKRLQGQTFEPVDLLVNIGHISKNQHWCAIHFRWLYTLKYGTENFSNSYNLIEKNEAQITDDPSWREKREEEYNQAATELKRYCLLEYAIKSAVYNQIIAPKNPLHNKNLHKFRQSLDILCKLWIK